jgi:hypothetical protein
MILYWTTVNLVRRSGVVGFSGIVGASHKTFSPLKQGSPSPDVSLRTYERPMMPQSRELAAQKGAVPSQTVAGEAEARHPQVLSSRMPSIAKTRNHAFTIL